MAEDKDLKAEMTPLLTVMLHEVLVEVGVENVFWYNYQKPSANNTYAFVDVMLNDQITQIVLFEHGEEYWYYDGKLHRDGKPATKRRKYNPFLDDLYYYEYSYYMNGVDIT
jgi:hypothetical protein